MSDGALVGLVILAAVASPYLLLAWEYLTAPRVPDPGEVRADMRESLMDRIARDELAPFFAEWDAEVGS